MVTVAVVGIGRWGKNLVRCFDTIADVACCCHAGDSSNAAWLAERYPRVALTEQYDRVLADDSVDAVALATPIATHTELAHEALDAGKDVFVEKPLSTDAGAARELVTRADELDRRLFTGYVFLYAPAIEELRRRLEDDPVVHLRTTWEKFGTFDSHIKYSLVCHDVALGHHLFETPFQKGVVTESTGVRTESDILSAVFDTPDGRQMASFYNRAASTNRKSLVALTESGRLYEFGDDQLLILEETGFEKVTLDDKTEPLLAECRAFVNWIVGGETPPSTGRFGARVDAVLAEL